MWNGPRNRRAPLRRREYTRRNQNSKIIAPQQTPRLADPIQRAMGHYGTVRNGVNMFRQARYLLTFFK